MWGRWHPKRLDLFFVEENICEKLRMYRSWLHSTGVYEQKYMILQLDFARRLCHYPFKFNLTWLLDEYFNDLVIERWAHFSVEAPGHLNLM